MMKQKEPKTQTAPRSEEDKMRSVTIETHKGKQYRVEKREDGKYLIDGKWMNLPNGWKEV